MDKLIADLLEIEQSASKSMEELDAERTAQAKRTSDAIARQRLEIQRKAGQALQAIKQEAEADTQARLEEIEQDYQEKARQIKHLFATNDSKWRKEWAARILQTTP